MRFPRIVSAAVLLLAAGCRTGPEGPRERPVMNVDGFESPPVQYEAVYRNITRHTHRMRPGTVQHVSVSADGKWITYASSEHRGTPQIYVQESEAVVAAQITGNSHRNLHPRISPDGRHVAYSSDRCGNWDIFVARINAPASVMQVTFEETDEIAPSWSPDGRRLVYASKSRTGVWMVVIMDWGSGIPTILGPGLHPDWGAQDLIAFQTQPGRSDSRVGIQIVRPDGRNLREVNFDRAGKYAAIHPRWSPDGRWLVFGVRDGNPVEMRYGPDGHSRDLWAVRADGMNAMPLTSGEMADEWWPSWGGGRIFFVSSRDEGYENVYSIEPRLIEADGEGESR